MDIPLNRVLKRQLHRGIAMLQDETMAAVYGALPNAVLHGGTAIWRCYGGKRFSGDLDFYSLKTKNMEGKIREETSKRGLEITRYKETKNTVFSKITGENAEIRLEIALRKPPQSEVRPYEKADGSTMEIFTLSPEELLFEKMNAYLNRKLIRDLYDVMFLASQAKATQKTQKKAHEFLKNTPKPIDEKNLKTIVYAGAIPSYTQMLETIKRRLST